MTAYKTLQEYMARKVNRSEAIYCLKCLAGCLLILAFTALLIVIGG